MGEMAEVDITLKTTTKKKHFAKSFGAQTTCQLIM